MLERRDGEAQRLASFLLLWLVVEVGGPVVDSTEALNGTGLGEEVLGKGRLAATGVARQDDASKMGWVDALHRHRRTYLTIARLSDGRVRGAGGGRGRGAEEGRRAAVWP